VLQSDSTGVTVRGSPSPELILNPQKEDVVMKEEEIKEQLMASNASLSSSGRGASPI
jgi:hypothetical protein